MFVLVINLEGESCKGFKSSDVKYGWWFKNVSIRFLGEDFRDISGTLQKKMSIKVPFLSVNVVGKVISEQKTCAVILFNKSEIVSLFFIFNRFMLKSLNYEVIVLTIFLEKLPFVNRLTPTKKGPS